MSKRTTFFTVDRKLLDEELWLNEPFTRGQAWIDLIGRASYADTQLTKRGELLISERGLAKRWKWSRGKVSRFLDYLEKEGMIMRTTNRANNRATYGTTLRIEKYEDYQNPRASERASNRARSEAIYNNINNINNLSNMPDGMAESLKTLFGDKFEALLEDVTRYYKSHPDKDFPGWEQAMAQFNANQVRWGRKDKTKKADSDDWFEGLEEELDKRGNW